MANGKPGDHPLTDIVVHGLPTFTPEVDALIKELDSLGGFESELASSYLLEMQSQLGSLEPAGAQTRLRNLRALLEFELSRLRTRAQGLNPGPGT